MKRNRVIPAALAALWLPFAFAAAGCERPADEPGAVEVTRDAEGKRRLEVDGEAVERNLERAGDNLEQGARATGEAIRRGAERLDEEVGPVVQDVLNDATITARVKAKLIADPEIQPFHIDVDTIEGRVTLNGIVRTENQRTEAEKLATRTEGVREVVNLLRVAGQEEEPPATGG
jgi:hypothetical protein